MNYIFDFMDKMAITRKGLKLLLAGFVVMVSGNLLLLGGGSDNPEVFNYAMFDFQRLVAAPVVIVTGIVLEIVAIMKVFAGTAGEGNGKSGK